MGVLMPISYTVSTNGTFAYFSCTGVIDLPDFKKILSDLARDDRLTPGFRQLFDFTAISSSLLTPTSLEKIIELAKVNPKVTNDTKLAIVVSSDSSFQNAKTYEKLANNEYQDIIVFNSLSTAKIWLGVEENGTS
jgi:hypothetical protein